MTKEEILRCVDPQPPTGSYAALEHSQWSTVDGVEDAIDWRIVHICAEDVEASPRGARFSLHSGDHFTELPADPLPAADPSPANNARGLQGFYATATCGRSPSVHPLWHNDNNELPSSDNIWFLLFAPDRAPEKIAIEASLPLTVDEAIALVSAGRSLAHAALFDHLVRVRCQPSDEFVALICLPAWAAHRTCVIFDSRHLDGRLFCLALDP